MLEFGHKIIVKSLDTALSKKLGYVLTGGFRRCIQRLHLIKGDVFVARNVLHHLITDNLELGFVCFALKFAGWDERNLVSNYHNHIVTNHASWHVVCRGTFN